MKISHAAILLCGAVLLCQSSSAQDAAENIHEKVGEYIGRLANRPWRGVAPCADYRVMEREARAFARQHPVKVVAATRAWIEAHPQAAQQAVEFISVCLRPEFEPILLELLSGDGFDREPYADMVVRSLGTLRSRAALQAYEALWPERGLANAVVYALSRLDDPRVVPLLCRIAGADGVPFPAAEAAVRALGSFRDKRAVVPLCELLERKAVTYGGILAEAAWALAEVGDRRAAPVLKRTVLKTSVPQFDRAPLWALLNLVPEDAPKNLRDTGKVYLSVFLEREDAIPWLHEVFSDPTDGYRAFAAFRELARLGETSIVPLIKKELRDLEPRKISGDAGWRGEFLEALFLLDDPELTELALHQMKMPYMRVPLPLAMYGDRSALRLLRSCKDGDRTAFMGLCRLGDAEDTSTVLDYCLNSKGRRDNFLSVWDGASAWVSLSGDDVILASEFFRRHDVAESLPVLKEWFPRVPAHNRRFVAQAVAEIGGAQADDWLVDRVRNAWCNQSGFEVAEVAVSTRGAVLLPRLRSLVAEQPLYPRRCLVAYCLARLGDTSGEEMIQTALATTPEPDEGAPISYGSPIGTYLRTLARLGRANASERVVEIAGAEDNHDAEQFFADLPADSGAMRRHEQLLRRLALDSRREGVRREAIRLLGGADNADTLQFLKSFPIGKRYGVVDQLMESRARVSSRLPVQMKQ